MVLKYSLKGQLSSLTASLTVVKHTFHSLQTKKHFLLNAQKKICYHMLIFFIALPCWLLITSGSFLSFCINRVKNTTLEPNNDLLCSLHLRVTLTSLGLKCCRRHEQETFSNWWLKSLLIILMGRETPEDRDNQRASSLCGSISKFPCCFITKQEAKWHMSPFSYL